MKTVLILFFSLMIGTMVQAQETTTEVKVNTIQKGIVVKASKEDATKMVRVYRYRNSRIKKALSFRTKRNKAKFA